MDEAPLRFPLVRELDGVRAVAVAIVFLSHIGLGRYVPGGLGVTIFFFLSGYLITSLLYAEAATRKRIDLAGFYIRRTLRIFPPLYLTLGVSALVVASGMIGRNISLHSVVSQFLFVSNYDRLIGPHRGLPGPPLWSLAVEEHYYLLFPLVFGAALLFMPARRAGWLCLAACIVPLGFRLLAWALGWDITLNYYFSHTRADSILFGAALALLANPVLHPASAWRPGPGLFLAACLFLVVVTILPGAVFAETWRYSLQGLALMPIFGFIVTPNRLTSPILTSAPAQIVGRFSYTFYLFHVLAIIVLRDVLPTRNPIVVGPIAFAVSMLYAWAMFVGVERPLARLRQRLHRVPTPEPMLAPTR
ncbi:MAG: acyltransferase [Sphingomonas fennica]